MRNVFGFLPANDSPRNLECILDAEDQDHGELIPTWIHYVCNLHTRCVKMVGVVGFAYGVQYHR